MMVMITRLVNFFLDLRSNMAFLVSNSLRKQFLFKSNTRPESTCWIWFPLYVFFFYPFLIHRNCIWKLLKPLQKNNGPSPSSLNDCTLAHKGFYWLKRTLEPLRLSSFHLNGSYQSFVPGRKKYLFPLEFPVRDSGNNTGLVNCLSEIIHLTILSTSKK